MRLLVRHSFSNSEVLGLLFHVIVVNVEHHMLAHLDSVGYGDRSGLLPRSGRSSELQS